MVMPTGAGKTITAATIVKSAAEKANTVWWLTHRRELISQASDTFNRLEIPHSTIQSGYVSDAHSLVQVASIQTIVRRLETLPPPEIICFDESHHISPGGQWAQIYDAFPNAKKIGLTATPWRLDGSGLGHFYDSMVIGPSMADLIKDGALTPYKMYAPSLPDLSGVKSIGGDFVKGALAKAMNKPKLVGDAIDHYLALCPGKRAIVFAAGIDNSKDIASQFRQSGIPAEHVDGSMSGQERDAAVARFASGETLILSNDSLFGEGFDVPAIEAVILLRPTQSLSLYLQMVGRGLRPALDKPHAVILDHAGNSRNKEDGGMGHGLPDDDREWTLEDREKRKKGAVAEVSIKQCPECFFVYRPAPKCPQCGHVAPVSVRKIEVIEGKLEEVIREKNLQSKLKRIEERDCKSLQDWQELATQRGYKQGWAMIRWQSRKKGNLSYG
jgi:superfamily II DNA or RNA helicase